MRKFQSLILALFLVFNSVSLFADGNHRSIDKVLQDIRTEQKLKQSEQINPDKVSPKLLEELGDAVMSLRHPDPRIHKQMDDMMGGEGSANLKAMHRTMGYSYLRGYGPGMGMMHSGGMMRFGYGQRMMNDYGPGRMGYGRRGGMMNGYGQGMMGGYGFGHGFFGGPWGWIIIIAVIALLVFIGLKYSKGNTNSSTTESALDILKKRYAKGEITDEEFEEKKKKL